jgi:ethanolamine utilization protein EutJ
MTEPSRLIAGLTIEQFLFALWSKLKEPVPPADGLVRVGLDFGTSSLVLVVLAADGTPLALAKEEAKVVREGLVLDYKGARQICQKLRLLLEEKLGLKLTKTTISVSPGTSERDIATQRFVSEAAGLEVVAIQDDLNSANRLLGISDGAVADLGAGTTGAALIRQGELISPCNEPTGGHHLSLVLAGHLDLPLEQAEAFKLDPSNTQTVGPLVAPVLSKIISILQTHLGDLRPKTLFLVGGTANYPGVKTIIEKETGFSVFIPVHPDLVIPAGIALGCQPYLARS